MVYSGLDASRYSGETRYMGNELMLSASEINLCLIGNELEKALIAACTGLKRYLNDPRQTVPSKATTPEPNQRMAYVTALEKALNASEVDAVTAKLLIQELRDALSDLKNVDEHLRTAAFATAARVQTRVCQLPSLVNEPIGSDETRSRLKRGLVSVGVGLAAAGAIGFVATPAGLAALTPLAVTGGVAATAEVIKLFLGHVFSTAMDRASGELEGLDALVSKCGCHCTAAN
jgi:hypothetical protein